MIEKLPNYSIFCRDLPDLVNKVISFKFLLVIWLLENIYLGPALSRKILNNTLKSYSAQLDS